jgi:MHS family alpha-ketoglutarate permease-like MFS transporter
MGVTPNPGDARGANTAVAASTRNAGGAASTAAPVRIRSIVGGLAGNLIEWYDFLAYSIFSIYFAKSFFPSDKPTVQLMNTAAIAAVGYVARPLGSWLIGLYADRRGRKSALTWSVTTMCVAR